MLFEIRNVDVTINKQIILNHISFTVDRGQVVGIIGPNGAGKSTLLKVASGLLKPTHGDVMLNDKSFSTSFQEFCHKIGSLIEEPSLYNFLTGREHLQLLLNYQTLNPTTDIQDLSGKLGIKSFLDKKIKSYSLGMRQRLGIASRLIHNPEFVILDEPTNSLDIHGIKEIREIIKELKDEGKGILLSSHLLSEVEEMCDKIIVIQNGKVIDLFHTNQHRSSQHDYAITLSGGKDVLTAVKEQYDQAIWREGEIVITIENNKLDSVLHDLIKMNCSITAIEKKSRKLEQIYFDKVGQNG